MKFDQAPSTTTDQPISEAPINPDAPVGSCPADADILKTYLDFLQGESTNRILAGSNPAEATINEHLQEAVTFCRVGHTNLARQALHDAELALATSPDTQKLAPYRRVFEDVHAYLQQSSQPSQMQ